MLPAEPMDEVLVPPLAIGKIPVTSPVKDTAAKVGTPVPFP